jgi:hypothetical protein
MRKPTRDATAPEPQEIYRRTKEEGERRLSRPPGWGDVAGNAGVAAAGNLIGGVLFVTLTRLSEARGTPRP